MNIISVENECIQFSRKEMIDLHREINTLNLDDKPKLIQLNLLLIELI